MIDPAGQRPHPGNASKERVLFLGGPIMPPANQFASLLELLGEEIDPLLKEYEVHEGAGPPEGYGIDAEVEGIQRAAASRGWETFHLVAYSAGGSLALAFAAIYPEGAQSLALLEPGEIGDGPLGFDDPQRGNYERIMSLPAEEGMRSFMAEALAPGVSPPSPPPGMPPPWAARPRDALVAFARALHRYRLDESRLREFRGPVYIALGSLSHPTFARIAEVISEVAPDVRVETFEGRHHLSPPHQAEPDRIAVALRDLWRRATVS